MKADHPPTNGRSTLDYAREYIARGIRVTPIRRGEKRPFRNEWQKELIPLNGVGMVFKPDGNIGAILGTASNHLVCVDLDSEIARRLAPGILPPTPAICGRTNSPGGHWFYRTDRVLPGKKWKVPKDSASQLGFANTVEYLADGQQVVVGPSIHPSGDVYDELTGEPSTVTADELIEACQRLHAAVLAELGIVDEPNQKANGNKKKSSPASKESSRASGIKRARSYLATIPPAVSGQGGHDATLVAAIKIVSFGISRDDVFTLMSEWNTTCVPPWSDSELWHKIDDAIKANPSPMEDRKRAGSNKDRTASTSSEESESDDEEEKPNAKEIDSMCEARSMLALRFTHQYGDESTLRLRRWRGSFWLWNGTHYREYSTDDVRAGTVKYLDESFCNLTKTAVSNVTLCLEAVTNVVSFRDMPSWLDNQSPDNWIAVRNGILNISGLLRGDSNILQPHTPNYFSANCLPYDFDSNATCPKWLAFLDRNQEGDLKRISILQQYAGYCLSSSLSMHKFLFNEGEGANGKSVYCAGLAGMLGTANISSVQLEQFGERFALYQTLGKMANICAEIGEIDKVAEGVLKAFTSGDAMTFERKNRDPITSRPTAKLVFASNNRPHFNDKSGGLWRRMIVMPWRIIIPEDERVRGMDSPQWWEQQGELPGILLWAIAGLYQLEQQGGFTKSEVCEASLDEYRGESNPARMFLEEQYRFEPESWEPCSVVYSAYHDWATKSGFSPMSSNSFGHEIRRAFSRVERREKYESGQRFRVYFGLEKRP